MADAAEHALGKDPIEVVKAELADTPVAGAVKQVASEMKVRQVFLRVGLSAVSLLCSVRFFSMLPSENEARKDASAAASCPRLLTTPARLR